MLLVALAREAKEARDARAQPVDRHDVKLDEHVAGEARHRDGNQLGTDGHDGPWRPRRAALHQGVGCGFGTAGAAVATGSMLGPRNAAAYGFFVGEKWEGGER